jgi:hypothetical protein
MRILAARICLILLALFLLTAWLPAALWYLLCAAVAGRSLSVAWDAATDHLAESAIAWYDAFLDPTGATDETFSGI